jgi:hypothetical protein
LQIAADAPIVTAARQRRPKTPVTGGIGGADSAIFSAAGIPPSSSAPAAAPTGGGAVDRISSTTACPPRRHHRDFAQKPTVGLVDPLAVRLRHPRPERRRRALSKDSRYRR